MSATGVASAGKAVADSKYVEPVTNIVKMGLVNPLLGSGQAASEVVGAYKEHEARGTEREVAQQEAAARAELAKQEGLLREKEAEAARGREAQLRALLARRPSLFQQLGSRQPSSRRTSLG